MGTQEHSHKFFFLLQEFHCAVLRHCIRHFRAHRLEFFYIPEQGSPVVFSAHLEIFSVADEFVDEKVPALARCEILLPAESEGVEGTCIYQCLKGFPVHHPAHPFHQIPRVGENAVPVPFRNQGIHDIASESLDASESETDIALAVDAECAVRLIDIRVEHQDPAPLAIVHYGLDLFHIGEILAEVGRLEFRQIVGL